MKYNQYNRWDSSLIYNKGDRTTHNDRIWVALQSLHPDDRNINKEPGNSKEWRRCLSE